MATEGGTPSSHTLEDTPTWALATVCFVFIFLGLGIEHLFHITTRWLKEHRKTALHEAVEKLKTVLMLLGLMSLILVVTQKSISKICIPNKVANSMLPCHKILNETLQTTQAYEVVRYVSSALFEPRAFEGMTQPQHRLLASTSATSTNSTDHCASKGMTSFISEQGINQLSTFICVLAIMQIVYSVATMLLGTAKMKSWKAWEQETQTIEYLVANDPNRFRLTRQTTFGKRHMTDLINTPILLWIKCFFRQFFHSVAKVDYFTLRHGFISAHHLSTNNTFNFRKYIQRSLEDDFKVVVGISPLMWFLLVILMLIDVHGWHMYLWVSFLPLVIVLVLGTKLQVIVAKMALRLKEQNNVIIGAPLVTPNDDLFWFSNPQFVLTLLHYTLFVNAFEFAFFVWVTLQYGIDSCFHETTSIVVTRVLLAIPIPQINNKDRLIFSKMAGESVRDMTSKFVKLAKFEGQDFRRWQKKMQFLLTTMKVVYVLTTPAPEEVEGETIDQIRKRNKFWNDDFICRGTILNGMCDTLFDIYQNVESAKELWETLQAKYMAEDSSSKKFLVSDFMNYRMIDGRSVMEQYNECLSILGRFTQHGLKMDESIATASIIDKLPPSWKDFKTTLKHKKEEYNLVELGSTISIEEGCRRMEKVWVNEKDKDIGGSNVNMVEETNNSFKKGSDSKNKKRKFQGNDYKKGNGKKAKQSNDGGCWKCGKPGHFKRDCRSGKGKNEAGTSGGSKGDPKQAG